FSYLFVLVGCCELAVASLLRLIPPFSLAFRHLILNNPNDGHQNGAAHAAAGDIAQNAGEVHRTAASCCASHYHLEKRSSQATADNSGDGISHGSETVFLHGCDPQVAPDCPPDYFNNQADD